IKSNRAYIYVGAFIFAAIFTPPDVISQILLAIPVILLFEMGVLISTKLFKN
ncbi:MAG: Sec-independent protein translocase subunit TatC, partial [Nitrosomonadales bacterium]|nr:Sec-independent protein translocase subunit TatC [Nitrosomonadales bacterium]